MGSIGSVFTSLKKKNDDIVAARRKARESKTGKKRVGHGKYVSTNSSNNSGAKKKTNSKFAKNPAGTTVQSQLDYFSNPENVKKAQAAVAAFRNSGKAKKNNKVEEKVKTKTKIKSNNSSTTKKGGVSAAELERQKKIIGRKNPKLEKLRNKLGVKKKESSSTNTKMPDLVALGRAGKADAVKGKTRQDIRREARDDKKARRRAGRTAKQTLKTPGGSITDEQNNANIAAEKAKIQKRREGRNQFLRNFGSQLTRGVQAGPSEGFKADKSDMNFFGGKKNEAASDTTTPQSPEQKEFENYANMQFDSISSKMGLTQDYDNKNVKNAGFGLGSYKSSDYIPSFNPSSENEDSNPTMAMKKIYKQKRGY